MACSIDFNLESWDVEYEDLDERARDSLCHLIKEPCRRSPETLEMEDLTDGRDRQAFQTKWSSATLKVLSSMPSRAAVWNSGTLPSRLSSGLRRRHTISQDFFQSSGMTDQTGAVQADSEELSPEENESEQLVSTLQRSSVAERARKLRAMPLRMAEKKALRRLAFSDTETSLINRDVPCYSRLKVYIVRTWQHCWFSCLPFLGSLQLWHSPLKKLAGRFGTGVVSYFTFLRTILLYNVFLLVISGLFLVIPQAIHPPPSGSSDHTFTGLEILTGKGYLSQSVMFYGYYTSTNESCRPADLTPGDTGEDSEQPVCDSIMGRHLMTYNIPLAYFFTICIAFLVTCIVLVYSISKSLERSYCVISSHGNLALKVFCSWDFKVSKKSSVQLQSENISTHLKELLSDLICGDEQNSWEQRLRRATVCLFAWTVCLSSISLAVLVIYLLSDHLHLQGQKMLAVDGTYLTEVHVLVLSTVVSGINLLLPGIFNLASHMESYNSPSVHIYVSIFRNLLLKVGVIGIMCYHWLGRIAAEPVSHGLQCWESFVGQELYRFLVMDFYLTVLYTLFGEFLWRLIIKRVFKRRKPVFDIARNVEELIYGQTLTWLGVLFSPLLPAVQIIRLVVLFYMKKTSLVLNYQPSGKPWRSSQMSTVFMSLLCFPSFLGAATSVIYTMWSIKPSSGCGPFRNLTSMYQAGKQWAQELENTSPNLAWLNWIYTFLLERPVFIFLAAGAILMVIFIYAQIVDGQKRIVRVLKQQIENGGMDKRFLITRLQAIYEERTVERTVASSSRL